MIDEAYVKRLEEENKKLQTLNVKLTDALVFTVAYFWQKIRTGKATEELAVGDWEWYVKTIKNHHVEPLQRYHEFYEVAKRLLDP
jgi:hypothetical protein